MIVTCVYAPYSLAFTNNLSVGIVSKSTFTYYTLIIVLDTTINLCFFADIFVNLFSAFQDKDLNVVDDPKVSFSVESEVSF